MLIMPALRMECLQVFWLRLAEIYCDLFNFTAVAAVVTALFTLTAVV